MTSSRARPQATGDLRCDPFGEFSPVGAQKRFQLLGADVLFETDSPTLMRLVDSAYAGLPRHRLPGPTPRLTVRLVLSPRPSPRRRNEPPPLNMMSGSGLFGGVTGLSNSVVISPEHRTALIVVSPNMLRFFYHLRYELIEFTVFTLAARVQGLVPLHAACLGKGDRGLLLLGPSGAGKSTVALQCLLQGLTFAAEDAVFVAPETLHATGIANFLHVQSHSLRWLERPQATAIRAAPVIRRRSGARKFEVDVRQLSCGLAAASLKLQTVVFLSSQRAAGRSLLRRLSKAELLDGLTATQAYAVQQAGWGKFANNMAHLDAFELSRGRHPCEAAAALRGLFEQRDSASRSG